MINDAAPQKSFYHRYSLVVGTIVLLLLVLYAADVLLLGFAGILLAFFCEVSPISSATWRKKKKAA